MGYFQIITIILLISVYVLGSPSGWILCGNSTNLAKQDIQKNCQNSTWIIERTRYEIIYPYEFLNNLNIPEEIEFYNETYTSDDFIQLFYQPIECEIFCASFSLSICSSMSDLIPGISCGSPCFCPPMKEVSRSSKIESWFY